MVENFCSVLQYRNYFKICIANIFFNLISLKKYQMSGNETMVKKWCRPSNRLSENQKVSVTTMKGVLWTLTILAWLKWSFDTKLCRHFAIMKCNGTLCGIMFRRGKQKPLNQATILAIKHFWRTKTLLQQGTLARVAKDEQKTQWRRRFLRLLKEKMYK